MIKAFRPVALLLLLPLFIGAKRKEPTLIGFHLESAESESVKDTARISVHSKIYRVRTTPDFSQRDIEGFYPFILEDGKSFGAAFRLKKKAIKRLQTLSTVAIGRKLFTVVNTDAIDFVIIDGPIDHGHITCWKGLTEKHIEQFKAAGFKQIEPQAPKATIALPPPLKEVIPPTRQ